VRKVLGKVECALDFKFQWIDWMAFKCRSPFFVLELLKNFNCEPPPHDGQHGILAKWESLAMQIEGDLPCPRSRQVRACFAFTEMQEHICAPISAGNSIDGGSWFETIEEPPRHVPS